MKRVSIFLIMVALIAGMAGCDGPSPSPQNLEIRDWYGLDAIRNNLGGHHILMNDLDSTTVGYEELASEAANQGKGWEPIGTWGNPFTGSFDGRDYKIRDLFIDRLGEGHVGLFSFVAEGGIIKNVGVVNVAVTGDEDVGGLVGQNTGTVSNSYSTGSVTGDEDVGGLVGQNWDGIVSNSYSTGNVTGEDGVGGLVGANGWYGGQGTVSNSYSTGSVTGKNYVGGLVGQNTGTVLNSYSSGTVTGNSSVGGLVGENGDGIVSNSYSTGDVTGEDGVGGLVGENDGTVSNAYSTGSVTGENYVGGLVGGNQYHGTVRNCYSLGSVTGENYVGGLVGENDGTMRNSFWDTETSGQATSASGTGKPTAEMKSITTFTAWDIIAVNPGQTDPSYAWNIVDGDTYPFLSWQSIA